MLERYCALFHFLPFASLLLAACGVNTSSCPATSQTSLEWRDHKQSVLQLTRYQTRGAFSYLSSQQKVYARFHWQQTSEDSYRVLLINPFGNTELDLKVQLGGAQLINNKGHRYISDNPDVMIKQLAGMTIPLGALKQWLLGLPGDATDFILDSRSHLRTLNYRQNDQGWNLTYLSYHEDILPPLPASLELHQVNNRVQFKIKIDSWSL